MITLVILILLALLPQLTHAQLINHQNWQSATIASNVITVDCAPLLLPFELARVLSEPNPTTARGEMDKSLRSPHPIKISMQPESGVSDTLTGISGCTTNGTRVQLATVDTGDSITVTHTPGSIEFVGGTSVVLDNPLKILTLQRKSGIWVADSSSSSSSSGVIENLTTGCTLGEIGVSDGAGQVNCGASIVELADCLTATTLGQICVETATGHIYRGDGTTIHRMSSIHFAADCSDYTDIGDLCIDADDGLVYRGDSEASVVIGGGAAGSQSLQDAFALGKVITGANSQANAFVVGNGTDGFRFYNNIMECFEGAAACDITLDIPTGKSLRIKYAGTDGIVIDSSGNVTLSGNLIQYKTYWFGAGSLSADSTNCLDPAERQINSGPKVWTIRCSDNAASVFYGSVTLPDSYTGGTVHFLLVAENENATPSGVLDFDISAMCRSDSDVINSTWGTAVPVAITFTTQYDVEQFWSASVTPNGPCAAGDTLFWKMTMDATATTTQVANTYVLGVKMEYPVNDWSDN